MRPCHTSTCSMGLPVLVFIFVSIISTVFANVGPSIINTQTLIVWPEDTPVGTILGNITAVDPDSPSIEFYITDKTTSEQVSLENARGDSSTGRTVDIVLLSELDRDFVVSAEVRLAIIVDDNKGDQSGNKIQQVIQLYVKDVNDVAPVFKPSRYTASVSEGVPIGTSVSKMTVSDPDTGRGGRVTFTMEATKINYEGAFRINSGTGVISSAVLLDYETQNFYSYTVKAEDGGGLNSTAMVTINVQDIQDTPPVFTNQPYSTNIPENTAVTTKVLQVTATDGDTQVRNSVVYSFISGRYEHFELHPTTGWISVKTVVDRDSDEDKERGGVFDMTVQAAEVDGAGQPMADSNHTATTLVTITVTDVNDNRPTFNSDKYQATILENMQEGVPITLISTPSFMNVSDIDMGSNSFFELYLMKDGQPYDDFTPQPSQIYAETTIMIRVKNRTVLDYELNKDITFQIVAAEKQTKELFSSSATVLLRIEDMNDNFPEFDKKKYTDTVKEDADVGTSILTLTASDLDTGTFGTITYSLRGNNNRFQIDNRTGEITVASLLDRETIDVYNLMAEARDGGGLTDFVNVEITLLDVNDNNPQFTRDYFGTIKENSLDFSREPLIVEATDSDKAGSNNSVVRYRIASVSSGLTPNFTIDAMSGEISVVRGLDYEDLDQAVNGRITVTVTAYDLGFPERQSDIDVIVQLEDVNDMTPEFNHTKYTASIPENLAELSTVLHVFAVDLDGTAPNNEFPYRIDTGAGDMFSINFKTGEIYVVNGGQLDREEKAWHELKISATDRGAIPLTGFCTVNITITDINDEVPQFEPEEVSASIPENAADGTEVKALTAVDPDLNPRLSFSIINKSLKAYDENGERVDVTGLGVDHYFAVNQDTGLVYVNGTLDRETAERVVLEVLVRDRNADPAANAHREQTATATLTVTLTDVNDNNPVFVPSAMYRINVSEGLDTNTDVLRIETMDKDKSSVISYTMGDDPFSNFDIDSGTGVLHLKNKLDRETRPELTVTVVATDNGNPHRSATGTVSIIVQDINDNSPVFEAYNLTYSISEGADVDTNIAQITASDQDLNEYAHIVYALDVQDNNDTLKINRDTGVISVAKKLDRETRSSYTIFVTASDNPGHPNDMRADRTRAITIRVLDINDNDPRFTNLADDTRASVVKLADVGQLILPVNAEDDDEGINAKLTYSLLSDRENVVPDKFNITTKEQIIGGVPKYFGEIVVSGDLLDMVGTIKITVVATDAGSPARSVSKAIQITVEDVNLNQPLFVHPPGPQATITTDEEKPFNFSIVAEDKDFGLNGEVTYEILQEGSDWRKFHIDPDTGNLTNRVVLDRETQERFEIKIKAIDRGQRKQLYSILTLIIVLLDIDDKPPVFRKDGNMYPYRLFIEEERVGPQSSHDLDIAEDLDAAVNNSIIFYYIIAGESQVSTHFHLDPSGNLTLTKPLDRESLENPTINMVVLATAKYYDDMPIVETDTFPPVNYSFDFSVLWVQVRITDINDNPPQFKQSVLTLGVTRDTGFGASIINLQDLVTDRDETMNVDFEVDKDAPIEIHLKDSNNVNKQPFLVFKNGTVKTNTHFRSDMYGYFLIHILASETRPDGPPFTAKALLRISLISDDQRLKVVFHSPPDEVRQFQVSFKEQLQNVTGVRIVVDKIQTHETDFGLPDVNMTDMFIHGEDLKTNETISASELKRLVDYYSEALLGLRYQYKVIRFVLAVSPMEEESMEDVYRMALILVTIILALLCVGVIVLFYLSRQKYRRKLRAATAMAYAASNGAGGGSEADLQKLEMPGTNVHAYENINPIYLEKVMLEEAGEQTLDDFIDDNAVDAPQTNGYSEEQKTMNFYQEDDNSNTIPEAKLGTGDAMLRLALSQHEANKQMRNGNVQNGNIDNTVNSFSGLPTTEI